ncbi:MAG: citrate/2-methylcitrate synthase [Candidatus Omnitrophica bacterium]|nr:citrate/2-methylcitrate synthase [Candidatus Omnitrophota bacterium]MDD5487817.1 citrate/2-methylcitrate synthase [Candidatus Omnitrophota bacterium]
MDELHMNTKDITALVLDAAKKARKETSGEGGYASRTSIAWPVNCIVGPGLEGAIACESKIGYVNGVKGALIYRGYDIFDLCAYSTFEEVSYLLIFGKLPTSAQLNGFKKELIEARKITETLRMLMGFPVEKMKAMSALRMGTNFLRHEFSYIDQDDHEIDLKSVIGSDEDSIPMETVPRGEKHAIYEFKRKKRRKTSSRHLHSAAGYKSCYSLISGIACIAGAVNRLREGRLPIEPREDLSHAGHLLYMMTGRMPTPAEERIMDISLILHADHGMNASTFAAMVVASTLSDLYFSVGAGIAALNGPLHGGANEQVIRMLQEIGSVDNVKPWFQRAQLEKRKIMGFGHRVYKAYDPRARVLRPMAEYLAASNKEAAKLFKIAGSLEKITVSSLGKEKKIFPNVDFYSGILYQALGISPHMFTPIFAVSRVSGWAARVMEYMQNNRIFRPRAIYSGTFDEKYVPIRNRR